MAARYRAGQIGYREAKEALLDAHRNRFGSVTAEFRELRADPSLLHQVLLQGNDRARATASEHLNAARDAVGIGALTRR